MSSSRLPEPTISRHFVSSLCESLSEHQAVTAAGLERFEFTNIAELARVPLRRYIGLFEWFSETLGSPWLGLKLSQSMGPDAIGASGYMFLVSRNLRLALDNLGRCLRAVQDSSTLYVGIDEEYTYVHYEILDSRIVHRRQDSEYSIGFIWHLMRLFSGNTCKLTMVEFEHDRPAEGDGPYRSIFGAPVLFRRPANRLHFRTEQLPIESHVGDPHLYPILEEQVHGAMDQADRISSFQDQVRATLTPESLGAGIRARAAAARLGISESTLHRRLRGEGTTFKRLFDDAAKSHASYLIAQKTVPIASIARRLGYAETACLTRAFRRWFNVSPREYRRGLSLH
ncbi:MAG: AraC family transcriptional regulator ligand-binding domain-containing protein [Pseudomonadota bacterium]